MDRTEPSHEPVATTATGELLRQHRLAAGLTQGSLAERAGLSVHGIQKLEGGTSHPQRETVQRLMAALQLAGSDAADFEIAARPAPRRREPRPAGESTRHNMPLGLTSFIGRQDELAELERLVGAPERSCRLVTLVGPGGSARPASPSS
jgi:transcriptional regulator with XRE-family HTH domain